MVQLIELQNNKHKAVFNIHNEVEIGDFANQDFKPHAKIKKWGDECHLSIEYQTTQVIKPIKETDILLNAVANTENQISKEKLKWKDDDKEIHFYTHDPDIDKYEEGAFEYEILLKKKPVTNKIELDIEINNLEFYYQPPLTQEEIEEGVTRPDDIVGSYAVYHATRQPIHTPGDDNKYKTCKAFHIFRPKIIDSNGNWVWGILNIYKNESDNIINSNVNSSGDWGITINSNKNNANDVKGKLIIEIPQTFLDNNAIYPISIDPTFGYTTVGASSASTWIPFGCKFLMTQNGTAQSITSRMSRANVSTTQIGNAIFTTTGSGPKALLAANNILGYRFLTNTVTSSPQWLTVGIFANLYANTRYWLVEWTQISGSGYFDGGGVAFQYTASSVFGDQTGAGWENWIRSPGLVGTFFSRILSIYCTYMVGQTNNSSSRRMSGRNKSMKLSRRMT